MREDWKVGELEKKIKKIHKPLENLLLSLDEEIKPPNRCGYESDEKLNDKFNDVWDDGPPWPGEWPDEDRY